MVRILIAKEKVKLWDMYLYLITLKQINSALVFALISSFGDNICQRFSYYFMPYKIRSYF